MLGEIAYRRDDIVSAQSLLERASPAYTMLGDDILVRVALPPARWGDQLSLVRAVLVLMLDRNNYFFMGTTLSSLIASTRNSWSLVEASIKSSSLTMLYLSKTSEFDDLIAS